MSRIVNGIKISEKPNRILGEVEELKGRRFGELTVLELYGKDKQGRAVWTCLCSCGNICNVRANHLKSGATISCGHINKQKTGEHLRKLQTKHNASKEPWFSNYCSMVIRSQNPNENDQKYYNHRKIQGPIIEKEWLNNPWAFYKEIGPKLKPTDSIDRINPNKGYVKGNIRWASKSLQALNRKKATGTKNLYKRISLEKAGSNRRKHNRYIARVTINGKTINLGRFYILENAMRCRYDYETEHNLFHTFKRPKGEYEKEPDYQHKENQFIHWSNERNIYRVYTKEGNKIKYLGTAQTIAEAKILQKNKIKISETRNVSKIKAVTDTGETLMFNDMAEIKRKYHTQAHIFRGTELVHKINSKRSPFYGWTFSREKK